MTKILTYNVNGIRAALKKDFDQFLEMENADVVCLQEIKANDDQFDVSIFTNLGYHCYWFSAQKKGYSGTAILCRQKPNHVEYGCGHDLFDFEGRVIRTDFDSYSVISAYFPSGSSGDARQEIKMQFLNYFYTYVQQLKNEGLKLIICGDYNICNKAIDIHNPKTNKNTSGFLPEERDWLDSFFESGYIDTFRFFNSEPHNYTWWSYRANARANNKGWRIDYIAADVIFKKQLKSAGILSEYIHSDHCGSVMVF